MTSEVPPQFDKPWDLSDVVIHTNNSDGKDIHAYKAALAMFSPYFRTLFFGDFKEKNASSTTVECDYDVMLEIMKNIHQIGFKYVGGQEAYDPGMLYKMYQAADRYDFLFIRNLCREHLEGYPSVIMASIAILIKRYDIFMNILMKLHKTDVHICLHQDCLDYSLNKEEFLLIFDKIVRKPLPQPTETKKAMEPLNLEEVTPDLKHPRVDLTKPWNGSDLMIITNNALGRVLYSNKTVIELMCPNFHRYLCTSDELMLEGSKRYLARIDEEYTTMKEILYVIHICKTNGKSNDRILHPTLLHSMYCAAGKERLDISIIRNTCVNMLVEHKSIDAVDVLWRLGLATSMVKVMDSLSVPQLRDWVYRDASQLSYRKGKGVFVVTPSQKQRLLSRDRTCMLISKFKGHFFPRK